MKQGAIAALLALAAMAAMADGRAQPDAAGVLAGYYGNTLVCAAARDGQDLCHMWMERDGSFINFDASGARHGHFTIGPMRADGKVPVCYFWDTALIPMPPTPPTPQPPRSSVTVCKTENFRSTCTHVDARSVSPEIANRPMLQSMAEQWHKGLCYPLQKKKVGDVWFEDDDPLPRELGKDKLMLLPGHR